MRLVSTSAFTDLKSCARAPDLILSTLRHSSEKATEAACSEEKDVSATMRRARASTSAWLSE